MFLKSQRSENEEYDRYIKNNILKNNDFKIARRYRNKKRYLKTKENRKNTTYK